MLELSGRIVRYALTVNNPYPHASALVLVVDDLVSIIVYAKINVKTYVVPSPSGTVLRFRALYSSPTDSGGGHASH